MPSKCHPADQHDLDILADATAYNVHLRRGPAWKLNVPCGTLGEAIRAHDAIVTLYGKAPAIYAIDDRGRQTLVTRAVQKAAREAA